MNKKAIIEQYVCSCVDNMDIDALIEFVQDTMTSRLNDMTEDEVIEEVREFYPEIIEELGK